MRYSTVYTTWPVFSLVLDKDVSPETALMYPELYKDLTKGRSLSFKSFFLWVLISLYQGGIIMYGAFLLFEDDFIHVVAITFTSLILTELIMVALTIRTWHWLMVIAELGSLVVYIASLVVLRNYFDPIFLGTWSFFWKFLVITAVSCIPLYIAKFLRKKFSPPVYAKLIRYDTLVLNWICGKKRLPLNIENNNEQLREKIIDRKLYGGSIHSEEYRMEGSDIP
ncbi:hypothetical protein DPMN_174149 [Dreissena polymorpha]|uniref:P-type ATPase C-terminal domain-containing protein n=1 Tax=Dreissena polymorpha TaxID=45954 RepID=A0A9D4E6X9_DREPO|nr:hypothetical protein DPMN_174149 [Dreissena polymorpha]